tara:strand:+ start:8832 stop:10076 length:1245 start_codon:yes stop_codon:yes gene_type:complete
MSRILKRPMFSMGGSTGAGITSGLSRKGYSKAGPVDWGEVDVIANQMRDRYGPVPKQGYNVYDFLTEWGLNMASSPPMGNVIQTAAGTAREPYSKMVEGKGKDQMAQYMANMASTDKALSAFTDIKVAETEAAANRELKNLPFKRQALKNAHEIQATKRQGEFGYDIQEALGIATGNIFLAEMMDEKGGSVNAGQIKRTYKEDGSGIAPIDFGAYDMDKIWWDPKKLQWLTIQIQEKDGVKSPEGIYHGSKEQAFAALGSTVKTGAGTEAGTGDGKKEPPPEGKTQIEGSQGIIVTIDEGDWNHGTTLSGNLIRNGKVYDKKTKRLIPNKNLNYLGNNKMHPFGYAKKDTTGSGAYIDQSGGHEGEDVFIYLDENEPSHPSKIIKEEKEKDYSELDKWWKNQTSNYGSGYQGVN